MENILQTTSNFYSLDIGGMTCASCVGRVEKAISKLPGVEGVSVNLATEQANVRLSKGVEVKLQDIIRAVEKTGYEAKLSSPRGKSKDQKDHSSWSMNGLSNVLISMCLSIPLVIPMILMPFGIHWSLSPWWQLALATPIQFILGWRFYSAGFKSLLGGTGNMDLLIAIGTSSAYGLSLYLMLTQSHVHELYFEGSAVIITMVLLGKWLEARAKKQTSAAIRALQNLWPENAKVLHQTENESHPNFNDFQVLPLEQVLPGDQIIVLPGERIPVDGQIGFGQSHADESLITGESEPVKKGLGDLVIGGSMNGEGSLIVKAQAIGVESVLSKIITLVEQAQTQKAPIQKLVDTISAIFVPTVIIIAIITGLTNWYFLDSISIAILRAVSVLVIACPCALGLATPAAIMAGTGVAARHGILIKDPQVLEFAHRLNIVAFDKTGTLTIGHPQLINVIPLSDHVNTSDMIASVAALQMGSEHPLAKAIINTAKTQEIMPFETTSSQAIVGVGIEGTIINGPWSGKLLRLQSLSSLENSKDYPIIKDRVLDGLNAGHTISILLCPDLDNPYIAAFVFGDEVKTNAKAVIEALHQLGIQTAMISGDNSFAANRVGKLLGIDQIFSQVLPSKKSQIIDQLQIASHQNSKNWVAMIGDGINDAPALAKADVGMAMSTGTDVAIQSAGITLMRGDLSLVPNAIDISRKTWQKIQQNLFWAFLFNTAGIPLAALGYLSPMVAGSAMALSSFCVLSNALLLKGWQLKKI